MLVSRADLRDVENLSPRANAISPFDPLAVYVHYECIDCFYEEPSRQSESAILLDGSRRAKMAHANLISCARAHSECSAREHRDAR